MKRVKSIVSLALALMVSVAVSAQTMDEFNEKYNEAGKALQEKNFDAAAKGFEEVIAMGEKIGPESIETVQKAQGYLITAYYMVGGSQAREKRYNEAIEALGKSEALAELTGKLPEKARAGNMLSQVYMALGADAYNSERYAEAAEIFSKGYAAAPNNSNLAINLANSYDKIDSVQKAIAVYQGIMKLTQPSHAQNVAKAKEDLTNMLLYRASEAAAAKDMDKVIEFTGYVTEYDPQNSVATLLRVQTANNLKKYADVVQYAQAAIDAQSDPAMKSEAYYLLGVAQQNRENTTAAISAFKNVTSGQFAAEAKKLITDLQ